VRIANGKTLFACGLLCKREFDAGDFLAF